MTNKRFLSLLFSAVLAVISAKAQQYNGYVFYAIQNQSTAYLIDTNSAVIKQWNFATTDKTAYSSYLAPGGQVIRTVKVTNTTFTGGGMSGKVQKVNWNGTATWNYTHSSTTFNLHHDICPMPNGNVLMISYELKTAAEGTQAGVSSTAHVMWPDKIIEVQPTGATTGNIVWEWHAWDHLVQNFDATKSNYQTSIVNHPELFNINYNNTSSTKDWIHMNGIDYNPLLDQITFSSHNLNEMYVIDHSTTTAQAASHTSGNAGKGGDLLYRWGNPAAYGATGTTILHVVHDAHFIPEGTPGAGNLVGFNNNGISTSSSCVDIITPPYNGYNYNLTLGSAYLPATYTSRIVPGGSSSNMSNSQQLPNGNSLITLALTGLIREYGPAGNLLWSKTAAGTVAQAQEYAVCYVDTAVPAIPTIAANATTLTSTSAASYQWYMNGALMPNETNQTLLPTQNGIYIVKTTNANACVYRYSVGYSFSITTNENVYKLHNNSNSIKVFPNPSTGIVSVNFDELDVAEFEVRVVNNIGDVVYKNTNTKNIDLSMLDNGIYHISITTNNKTFSSKKLILMK